MVDLEDGQKYQVIVLDNQSTGHPAAIPKNVAYEKADIRDKASLDKVFKKHHIDAVMHFGASISVAESCADPLGYYENNVLGTLNVLSVMRDNGVKLFIFSSTAAVFGMPEKASIEADDAKAPINPYGETKLAVEKCLRWCDEAYGIKYVCLRYFNACGAHKSGEIGEDHQHETHLVPLILHVALGKRSNIKIYGADYPTADGTCVRDYVHVTDLATAHIKALEYIQAGNPSDCFNLGSGTGYSVLQIIEAARKVTQHPIPSVTEARRAGDPPALVACSKKAEKLLGWQRQYNDIESIVETAWRFHKKFPNGYTK